MRKKMDFFGKALYEYWKGDKTSRLFFIENRKKTFPIQVSRYFRSYEDFSDLEMKSISLARGDILDVGCAMCYHVTALKRLGDVDGIDVSKHVIKIANEQGIENCFVADIFKYHPSKKYDTITLFENNIGLAGTISKTKKFIKILAKLLKEDGQILCVMVRTRTVDTWCVLLTPLWNNKKGKSFKWLHFSPNFLSKICTKYSLNLELLQEKEISGNIWCLIRIFHKSS